MSVLDPYRTLGLLPGATGAEVKRAYRRLAKQYHPDSAGERTLPRFLEIQAAYETLVGGRGGNGLPMAPGHRRPGSPQGARERSRESATNPGESTRTSSRRPAGGRAGGAEGPSGGGPGSRGSASGRSRSTRQRATRKATLGSTSYDEAAAEPFEPTWGGSTWYGTASGTYWTINPKEYADPRKHGPGYQERARRASQAGAAPASAAPASPEPASAAEAGEPASPRNTEGPRTAPPPAAPPSPPGPPMARPSGTVVPFVLAGLGLTIPAGLVAASGSVSLGFMALALAAGVMVAAVLVRGRRAP